MMSTSHQTLALLETTLAVQRIYSRGGTIEQRQNDDTLPCMARLCADACQRRATRWVANPHLLPDEGKLKVH
jgi:hypothetical protein